MESAFGLLHVVDLVHQFWSSLRSQQFLKTSLAFLPWWTVRCFPGDFFPLPQSVHKEEDLTRTSRGRAPWSGSTEVGRSLGQKSQLWNP